MVGIRVRRRAVALFAAAATLVGGELVAVSPAAADGSVTVVWPAITALNPDVTDYVIDVDYTGTGHLRLWNTGKSAVQSTEPVPASGSHVVTFPEGGDGERWLRLMECPTEEFTSDCRLRGLQSPIVNVYSRFIARESAPSLVGPSLPLDVTLHPAATTDLDVTWEVVPRYHDEQVLASGSAAGVPAGGPLPPIGPADGLEDGSQYEYRATISGSAGVYGQLEGHVSVEFEWDSVNRAKKIGFEVKDSFLHRGIKDADVFYPAPDKDYQWRDQVRIVLDGTTDPMGEVQTTITAPDGGTILAVDDRSFLWSGEDSNGDLVPEGSYTVTMDTFDLAGNEKTVLGHIRVSHEQLVQTTWKRTVSPRSTMIDKYVGGCAALKTPARPGWRGSLGFRSTARCTAARNAVATSHGIYIPTGPFRMHLWVRVDTYGGAARGAAGSALSMHQYNRRSDWIGRARLDSRLRTHRGNQVSAIRAVLGDAAEDPYVIWSVGLDDGTAYDVKTFTVNVRYWDVR